MDQDKSTTNELAGAPRNYGGNDSLRCCRGKSVPRRHHGRLGVLRFAAGLRRQVQRSSPDRRRFCRSRSPYPEIPVPWLLPVCSGRDFHTACPKSLEAACALVRIQLAAIDMELLNLTQAARPRMSCLAPPISIGFRLPSRARQETRSAPARDIGARRLPSNPRTSFCRKPWCAPGRPRLRPHAP